MALFDFDRLHMKNRGLPYLIKKK